MAWPDASGRPPASPPRSLANRSGWFASRRVDIASALQTRRFAAPLAHAEADFLGPLRFGDSVRVAVVNARIGTTSLTVGYRIVSAQADWSLAFGHTVSVFVHGQTFEPMPVPDDIRQALSMTSRLPPPVPGGGRASRPPT